MDAFAPEHKQERRTDSALQCNTIETPFNCAAVSWALERDVASASASRLLIEMARHSVGGRCTRTQVGLGAACRLSERQTRTLIASLIADKIITRTRNGGAGKGRGSDAYEFVGYTEQPAMFSATETATGNDTKVAATCNRQQVSGSPEATGNFDRKELPIAATGNAFPPHPPINTTSLSEGSKPSNTEDVADRGLGNDLLGEAPAKAKRRRSARKAKPGKFYASEATIPAECPAELLTIATSAGLRNGTCKLEWVSFRRWHIENETLIASLSGRWATWVRNWAKSNPKRESGAAPKGYKFAGNGPDGKPRYNRDHSQNYYR